MSKVVFKPKDLPPMPQVVAKIIQIDENNIDVSSDQLQSLIRVDPALTSKILKIANSAFYARSSKVTSLSQAITLLGFKTIKSLTLLVSASDLFPKKKNFNEIQRELWMRSVIGALVSKILADRMGLKKIQEEIFMATLLKNLGQLILFNKNEIAYEKCFSASRHGIESLQLAEAEKKEFGLTSTEASVLAMQTWNFPDKLVESASQLPYILPETDDKDESISNIIQVAALAEVIVVIKNLTGDFAAPEEVVEKLSILFKHLVDSLEASYALRSYIDDELEEAIKSDNFFAFCTEMFSS